MVTMRDVVLGFSMLQYGPVMAWGRQPKPADRPALPSGEADPPLDFWLALLSRCETFEEVRVLLDRARSELEAWRCRPEPPPEGETFDDLKARIIDEGEGWTPHEVALSMRVTPTLVRNVRHELERDPEYGRPDGSLAHGIALIVSGCTVRQAAQITGIPRSTLHDAHRRACQI
jgi:helix-turn-helix, Psq domain